MKNIVVFIMLCLALAGCKTRKSHVQKSSMDSTEVKREQNNIGIVAESAKVTNTSSSLDSNWMNAIRLTNFSGQLAVVSGQFIVDGHADQAQVTQTGTKSRDERSSADQKDSMSAEQTTTSESDTRVEQKESDSQKERKGWTAPWWVWVVGLVAAVLFFNVLYRTFKSKFKLF